MDAIYQDLRQAVRALGRHPSLAITAIIMFACGIGVNATLFSVIQRLFLYDPPHVVDPSRVVRLYLEQRSPVLGHTVVPIATYPSYRGIRDGSQGFAQLAAYSSQLLSIGRGSDAKHTNVGVATATFFPLVGVHPWRGRFFTAEEDSTGAGVAVLGYEFWRRQFGSDLGVIGRPLAFGKQIYTIIGIAPEGFSGIDLGAVDAWLPLGTVAKELGYPLDCTDCYWLTTIARLGRGVSMAHASAEATLAYRRSIGRSTGSAQVLLGPIQEARGPDSPASATLSFWLGLVSCMVLLIACANVANLLLVRAIRREREIAIRLALGVGRWRLIRQLLTEGLVLAVIGGVGALAIAALAVPILAGYFLPPNSDAALMDWRVLAFTGAIAIVAGLAASVAPAIRSSGTQITEMMRPGSRPGALRHSTTQGLLVIGQIGLTLTLLFGAALFVRSFRNVVGIPLGFTPDNLIAVGADFKALGFAKPDVNRIYNDMWRKIKALPGVTGVTLAIGSPFAVSLAIPIDLPGVDDSLLQGSDGVPYFQAVAPNYFATLGTRLLSGRVFTSADQFGSPRVAIVDQTMARRLWPGQDAIGQCIKAGKGAPPCSKVVGVVEDIRRNGLTERPTMQYYVPLPQVDSAFFLPVTALLVRTQGQANAMVGPIRRVVQASGADLPYIDVAPIDALYEPQLRPWRLGSSLFTALGLLALVMATIGLHGIMSYIATQRRKELGIRMALGAHRTDIVGLILRRALIIAIVGVALGVLAALAVGRAVSALLYDVSPGSPLLLVGAATALLIVALLASSGPALKAAAIDPAEALKQD